MSQGEEIMLLRDADVKPTLDYLEGALGDSLFKTYNALLDLIINEFELSDEWKFYNDGKAWLCKVVDKKKKTIFWLSAWNGFIKISFHFTQKTYEGVFNLDIDLALKDELKKTPFKGKLIALIIDIKSADSFDDLRELIKYKKE